MAVELEAPPPKGAKPAPDPKAKTIQVRAWKGQNNTDARVAIDDEELFWLENGMTIGKGAIQILPKQGASIATIAAGVARHFGFNLTIAGTSTPVLIVVGTDGSLVQVHAQTGAQTAIAPAGTVTTSAQMTIFRDGPVLIIDPTFGYMSWTGAVFAVIDATKTGNAIAVFEGRAWLANGARTIRFTAPSTFNDFAAGNGAGSTIITDEAFPGNVVATISGLEQLWVFGQGAVEAIANVVASGVAPAVVTTFSITNIVAGLGSNADASQAIYFRSVSFMSPFGEYALAGVTPQKLSDKLDGLFPALTLSHAPAAVAVVQNLLVLMFLVTYTPSLVPALPTPASGLATAAPLLLCFVNGKHFVATQGALTWITTLIVSGVSQAWGTDGSTLYQLFGDATSASVAYKVVSKLSDHGLATTEKAETKLGFEYQAAAPIAPTITIDNESSSQTAAVTFGNTLTVVNNVGATLTILNNVNNPLSISSQGMVLARSLVSMWGRYLGWTITGTDPPYRIQALQSEIVPSREWQAA